MRIAAALLLCAVATGCGGRSDRSAEATERSVPVSIAGPGGTQRFAAELADTEALQAKGMMYRTDPPPTTAMLFAPYPPGGGAPRPASFWMKNTPSPLDIVFIRPDGTIARIEENAVPFSEQPIASGEPVAAVLELVGGRAAELGIAPGDRVDWPGRRGGSGARTVAGGAGRG